MNKIINYDFKLSKNLIVICYFDADWASNSPYM